MEKWDAYDRHLNKIDELILVEPSLEYAEDLWAFRQEIIDKDADNEDQFAGCMSLQISVERCVLFASNGMTKSDNRYILFG